MVLQKTVILQATDIQKKTERLAWQIYENNFSVDELLLLGIAQKGYQFARRIQSQLEDISELSTALFKVQLNKSTPYEEAHYFEPHLPEVQGKHIILIDDVANTGKTLCYALKPLLNALPASIQVAVLVDRDHKTFPIHCDYVGLRLSTTLQEHISVELSENGGSDLVYIE